MRNLQFKRDVRRAFSLIEIMVAVTLLTVITVGLLAMFYHTQRAFRIGTSQVDVLEGGRATLRMVALDLQEMYPSRIDQVVNFSAAPTSTLRIDMPLPDNQVMENLLQDVAFLTRRGNEWSATAYRVHHANGAGTLYRAVISTNVGTLLTSATATAKVMDQWVAVSNLFWLVTQPAVPSITNATTPYLPFDRVADGVVHFRVHAYDNKGIRLVETNSVYAKQWNEIYSFTNWVPEYVELELGVLDPKAMKQFQARAGTTPAADQAQQNYLKGQGYRTHFFHQRVQIRSRREEFDLFAGP
jgi:prepilin-type N-terminal cleavage/methylation domain-containing protein